MLSKFKMVAAAILDIDFHIRFCNQSSGHFALDVYFKFQQNRLNHSKVTEFFCRFFYNGISLLTALSGPKIYVCSVRLMWWIGNSNY